MGTTRGNQDIVTRPKLAFGFSLDPQTGRARDKQDPLVVFLIIGFVHRRGLASRDDPLDSHTLSPEQLRKDLLIRLRREVIEKIHHSRTLARDKQSSTTNRLRNFPAQRSCLKIGI